MSSSNRTPFQDISNDQSKDPKEVKRQKERERYARNKDEITKRLHELRELKKLSKAHVNDENILFHTQATGQSAVTQTQYRATEGVAPNFEHNASENPHGRISLLGNDDESEWLHRCDAYQRQAKPGGMRHHVIAQQNNFLAPGSPTELTGTCAYASLVSIDHQTPENIQDCSGPSGQNWYAQLNDKQKSDHLMKMRVSWQQKKATDLDTDDVFSLLRDESIINITGIIMYVSPIDHDTYFPIRMREVAVLDSTNHIVFLRILNELVQRYTETLLVGERNTSIVRATSMKVDQASRTLLSTATSTLNFDCCSTCHQFDMLEGLREQMRNDPYYLEAVKNVVLRNHAARTGSLKYLPQLLQ